MSSKIFGNYIINKSYMYAIVEIAGQQFKVQKDQKVFVHRLDSEAGSKITFDKVLLVDNDGDITLGAPAIEGATITAEVVEHVKGETVIVFKKKRRKGYRKKNGHRQSFTKIEIGAISLNGSSSKAASKTSATKEVPVAAKAVKDDLTMIKGIGPVHAKELAAAGFTSFEQIAKLSKSDIEKIDAIDGISAGMVESEDWSGQATTLNNFKALIENVGSAKQSSKNDLTEINGIGEVTEKDLNEVGIYTFEQISKIHVKDMEYLSAINGITRNKIESEEWVKQAKDLLKK